MSRFQAVMVCAFLATLPLRAGPALVIAPPADDDAVRRGLTAVGTDQVSPDDTASLLEAAKGSGLSCGEADGVCWLRVAQLAGHDTVVLVTAAELILSGTSGVRRVPRLARGPDGIQGAVRRLVGSAGAIVVVLDGVVEGTTAAVTLAGVGGGPVFDGVGPGVHTVEASAGGLIPRRENVAVTAGEVARLQLTLTPEVIAAAGPSLKPTLLWGGVGAAGLGVVAGSAIATVGWFAGECTFDAFSCVEKGVADTYSVVGIGVGAGFALAGVASMIGSVVVD